LDWSAALGLLLEFDDPAAVVIKHTNPCGAAIGRTAGDAIRKAKASDPVSIYGGIVGINRPLDMDVVKELSGVLLEILFAPAYGRTRWRSCDGPRRNVGSSSFRAIESTIRPSATRPAA